MENDVRVEFGREATDELKELVGEARENLLIVSPWLSSSTVKMALERQENGVKTRIVTTADANDSKSHFRALGDLIEKKQRTKRGARPKLQTVGLGAIGLGALGLLTLSLTGYLSVMLLVVMIASVIAGGALYSIGREALEDYWAPKVSGLVILNSNPLLHAKVYAIDGVLAVGSPNFTWTGLNKNIEALAFIEDGETANRAAKDILSTIEESSLYQLSLEEVWKTSKRVEGGKNDR